MTKLWSLLYLALFSVLLFGLRFLVIPVAFPELPPESDLWFASGLLLVVLGVFLTEKYFTKPLDVIVNVITLLIVLWTVDAYRTFTLYPALLFYVGTVGGMAFFAFVLSSEDKDNNALSQRISNTLFSVSTFLGSSKVLFSIVFVLSYFHYFVDALRTQGGTPRELAAYSLIVFWGFAILVEPIHRRVVVPIVEFIAGRKQSSRVGRVSKKVNPNIVIIEEAAKSERLDFGDILGISTGKTAPKGDMCTLVMFIDYLEAEDRRYAYCYVIAKGTEDDETQTQYAYALGEESLDTAQRRLNASKVYTGRNRMIGTVHSNSDIDVIHIKMIKGVDRRIKINEGDLVSLELYGNPTKYQIINAKTEFESITNTSRSGLKNISAQQIGAWGEANHSFKSMTWVPDPNTPVFLEESRDLPAADRGDRYFPVGNIPRSPYPVYVDLERAISHHIAIIGKTGTGKSRMAAKLVERMAAFGCKVVILEVDRTHEQSLTRYIDPSLVEEQDAQSFNPTATEKNVIAIKWADRARREGNTASMTDEAADVIEKALAYQMQNPQQRISIVMEEAYDFVPENNFGKQDFGQPQVSRINQLALKCRKHNVGFVVITQRTAIVTKTMLYQCHTVIALQSFDETSKQFMSAYIDQRYLESMSVLPRFRAIVVGKGSTCEKPVIVDFEDTSLSSTENDAEQAEASG